MVSGKGAWDLGTATCELVTQQWKRKSCPSAKCLPFLSEFGSAPVPLEASSALAVAAFLQASDTLVPSRPLAVPGCHDSHSRPLPCQMLLPQRQRHRSGARRAVPKASHGPRVGARARLCRGRRARRFHPPSRTADAPSTRGSRNSGSHPAGLQPLRLPRGSAVPGASAPAQTWPPSAFHKSGAFLLADPRAQGRASRALQAARLDGVLRQRLCPDRKCGNQCRRAEQKSESGVKVPARPEKSLPAWEGENGVHRSCFLRSSSNGQNQGRPSCGASEIRVGTPVAGGPVPASPSSLGAWMPRQ